MLFTQRSALAVALLALTNVAMVAADDVLCALQPPPLPRHADYIERCTKVAQGPMREKGTWPCFRQWTYYSLLDAEVYPSLEITGSADSNIIAPEDGDLYNFTPMDKTKPFSINYPIAGISFSYNPSKHPSCYTLSVDKWAPNTDHVMHIQDSGGAIVISTSMKLTFPKSAKLCDRAVYIELRKRLHDE